jgi:hypothetical protein
MTLVRRTNYTDRSDLILPAKLVAISADRGCHVVSAAVHYGRNLYFLDQIRYYFFQAAPRLYSRC